MSVLELLVLDAECLSDARKKLYA